MFFNSKKKVKKRRDALCIEANTFIQVHYVRERSTGKYKFNTLTLKSDPERDKVAAWYEEHNNPTTYSDISYTYFKDCGKDENTICEKYLLEKGYFSKILSNPSYHPSKGEAITICFAFHLSFEASKALLKSADYALTNSEKSDLIVRFFLEKENYNINDLNYVLQKITEVKLKDLI